jgi:glucose-1-phosphate cytidylyltransferase
MKVAILAGGVGSRLAEETVSRPKPMVEIGGKPILWHIMMHYAGFGFRDFAIATGYKAHVIKRWFVEMAQLEGDLHVDVARGAVSRRNTDPPDWRVDLVDTGEDTNTGGRVGELARVIGRERFMLTWGDGVSNVDLDALLAFHRSHGRIATMTAVRPPARFGHLTLDGSQIVDFVEKPQHGEGWINGAFFVLEPEVFDYIDGPACHFESGPLRRLARDGQLMAYKHTGFWQCMDTVHDRKKLEDIWAAGNAPWATWNNKVCAFSYPAIAAM